MIQIQISACIIHLQLCIDDFRKYTNDNKWCLKILCLYKTRTIQKNDNLTLMGKTNTKTAGEKQVNTEENRIGNGMTWYKEHVMMPSIITDQEGGWYHWLLAGLLHQPSSRSSTSSTSSITSSSPTLISSTSSSSLLLLPPGIFLVLGPCSSLRVSNSLSIVSCKFTSSLALLHFATSPTPFQHS